MRSDKPRSAVTPELLREFLRYDSETGELFWRERSARYFPLVRQERQARQWNTRCAGKPAMLSKINGHCVGSIFNYLFQAHRVAWAIHYGKWPDKVIDHINGNPADNRIINLRDVETCENSRNVAIPKNNKTGYPGVRKTPYGRWRSELWYDNGRINLGSFDTFEAAKDARKSAEAKYGFHPNHGRVSA